MALVNKIFCRHLATRAFLTNYGDRLGKVFVRNYKKDVERKVRAYWERSRDIRCVPAMPRHRSEWQEWNYNCEVFAFGQRLGENFNQDNLKIAFTEKSYVEKERERMEKLGLQDVTIDLKTNTLLVESGQKFMSPFIKAYLRNNLPRVPEDAIRGIHDYLLSDPILADISQWLGCVDLILCADFPPSEASLSRSVKAVIGCLLQDGGIERTEKFLIDFIATYLATKDLLEIWSVSNPLKVLCQILEKEHLPHAEARLLRESASGTLQACYVIGLYINKELIGSAPGETVAIAEEMAAHDALRRIFDLTESTQLKFGQKAYNQNYKDYQVERLYLKDGWSPSVIKNGLKIGAFEAH